MRVMTAVCTPPLDDLRITDLELQTRIGVPAEERLREQRVLVTIGLALNTREVGETDDVRKSIDYQKLAHDVRELAGMERRTIERLARDIAEMTLNTYAPQSVTVTVKKFPAVGAQEVAVTITRP